MKVLVTGATGFIGSHLIKELKHKQYDVYCLARKTSNIKNLVSLETNIMYGDITSVDSLDSAVKGMDYIYHLASATKPRDFDCYYRINALGTKNLIEACVHHNPHIKKFIYTSSISAAGYSYNGQPLKESDPPHPVTPYGRSKLAGEKTVLGYKEDLPVVILRPPTVYGLGNMFFGYLANMLALGIKPMWDGYTSLCYIDDFIDGLIVAGENKKSASKIFFVCDGTTYSWRQIIDRMACLLGKKTLTVNIPRGVIAAASLLLHSLPNVIRKPSMANKLTELRYLYWVCDPARIMRELDFQSKFSLEQGLEQTFLNKPVRSFT